MPSTFPAQLDNIPSFIDVAVSDASLISQFQTAMQAGNFTLAAQIYNQIPNANNKLVGANRLNQLIDCLMAVEQFYGTDVEPYIETKQTEWLSIINQFSYLSTYSSSTQYVKNNTVLYTSPNTIPLVYVNIFDGITPTGTLPTNTTYWRQLTVRGATGNSGGQFSFKFDWNASTTYYAKDVAIYQNAWWVALSTNANTPPFVGSTVWQQVLTMNQADYPISSTEPGGQVVGDLWFKVL